MLKKGLRENPKVTPEGREFQLTNVTNNRGLITLMNERIVTLNQLVGFVTNFQIVKSYQTRL